ncbi:MAG: YidB family protein [Methyloceanibacter sp.]|uniref:YidB family protein n=1 Tax=Methyloceanibacter sp. TaxID=1965321 RepID=UPI003D9AEE0C
MSRGFPSMTALLGLLAIAGYQNRDKIAEVLGGLGQNKTGPDGQRIPGADGQSGLGGLLEQLGLGGASAGGILNGGLGELVDRFKQSGQGEMAESWVNTGPNKQCTAAQLEQAIGPEVLATLSKQTGLSRDDLVARLCRELPDAVDKYTPLGRLPVEADLSRA